MGCKKSTPVDAAAQRRVSGSGRRPTGPTPRRNPLLGVVPSQARQVDDDDAFGDDHLSDRSNTSSRLPASQVRMSDGDQEMLRSMATNAEEEYSTAAAPPYVAAVAPSISQLPRTDESSVPTRQAVPLPPHPFGHNHLLNHSVESTCKEEEEYFFTVSGKRHHPSPRAVSPPASKGATRTSPTMSSEPSLEVEDGLVQYTSAAVGAAGCIVPNFSAQSEGVSNATITTPTGDTQQNPNQNVADLTQVVPGGVILSLQSYDDGLENTPLSQPALSRSSSMRKGVAPYSSSGSQRLLDPFDDDVTDAESFFRNQVQRQANQASSSQAHQFKPRSSSLTSAKVPPAATSCVHEREDSLTPYDLRQLASPTTACTAAGGGGGGGGGAGFRFGGGSLSPLPDDVSSCCASSDQSDHPNGRNVFGAVSDWGGGFGLPDPCLQPLLALYDADVLSPEGSLHGGGPWYSGAASEATATSFSEKESSLKMWPGSSHSASSRQLSSLDSAPLM